MTTATQVRTYPLTDEQFGVIRALVRRVAGISLSDGKKDLVRSRLNKRLRRLGLASYDDYLQLLRDDRGGEETTLLIDAISTNVTEFFREPAHFRFLAGHLRELAAGGRRKLRIWSAGCSSGQEPYTVAITLLEVLDGLRGWDARVLATDISTNVLDRARNAVYDPASLAKVSRDVAARHFARERDDEGRSVVRVGPAARRLVHFARLNLMGPWPMKGPLDAIFCRNVMIYFEKETQIELVRRFWQLLGPGGILFVGHSENLRGFEREFKPVQPTVYRKVGHRDGGQG